MPVIRERCEEIDRDPRTLRVSVHVWWEHMPSDADEIARLLAGYAELGVARVQTLPRSAVSDRAALERLVDGMRLSDVRGATVT